MNGKTRRTQIKLRGKGKIRRQAVELHLKGQKKPRVNRPIFGVKN